MKTRPVACLALLVFLLLTILPEGLFYEPRQITEKCQVQVVGQVTRHACKKDKVQLDLTDCLIQSSEEQFRTKHLLIYLANPDEYPVGAVLSLSGTIYPTEKPTNPGQFDSRLYYGGKGISYTVFAERAEILKVYSRPLREGLLRLRGRIGEVYDTVFAEQDSGLMKSMVLGEKGDLDAEIKELYQKNGISHLLAISGLHISMIGLGIYRILRRMTGSFILAGFPAICFTGAYGWMTGASISAVRAAVMCGLIILAEIVGRTYDMLTSIGTVALVLMLTNPLSVKQSAFLLSFGAVAALGLLTPLWLLGRFGQGKVFRTLSPGISVLAVTFPMLLCFFHEYPLYSVFLNLLVIPLMSVLMTCGLVCGLTGLVWLPASRLSGRLCSLILCGYRWLGERCLSLPGSVLAIGTPPVWKIVFYYTVLGIVVFVLYREKRRKKYWRGEKPFRLNKITVAGCGLSLVFAACLLCLRVYTGFSATMLDVGQGDCIFFREPNGTTFLYDGGSSNVSEVGTHRILPFLRSEGVGKLDYVMISHMDKDHISGIMELLEECGKPGGLKIGHGVFPALEGEDPAYAEMEELFREKNIPILYMEAGDRLSGDDLSLTCLWPGGNAASEDRNELSMVMLAEYGEFQMLLTGDIGESTERILAESGALSEVEILKAAHHGSRHSSGKIFLSRVRPSVSVISCGAGNRYGHPGEETLQRLEDAGSRIFITKDCGAVRIWTDGYRVKVRGFTDG